MTAASRRQRLRDILTGDRCVRPALIYDPVSARLAKDMGYDLAMLGGSDASLAVLGDPDIALITLTELVEQVHRICRAADLPLLVDADHGYGNALNVRRTVRELETVGAAGLTIEDTLLPAPFGNAADSKLIPTAEAVAKMSAALEARQDPALAIVGRTALPLCDGVADCRDRLQAYGATGVDALFVTGVESAEALKLVSDAAPLPLVLGRYDGDHEDQAFLASRGVRVCLPRTKSIRNAMAAVFEALLRIHPDSAPRIAEPADKLLDRVTRKADYERLAKTFLER